MISAAFVHRRLDRHALVAEDADDVAYHRNVAEVARWAVSHPNVLQLSHRQGHERIEPSGLGVEPLPVVLLLLQKSLFSILARIGARGPGVCGAELAMERLEAVMH